MDIKIVMYLVIEALAIVIAWHVCGYVWERFQLWNTNRQLSNATRRLMKLLKDAEAAAGRENETALEEQVKNIQPKIMQWSEIKPIDTCSFPTPSPTPAADPFQKKPRGYKLHDGKPCTYKNGTVLDVIRRDGKKERITIEDIMQGPHSTFHHCDVFKGLDIIWIREVKTKQTKRKAKKSTKSKARK